MLPSRVTTVARVVPPLARLFARALSSTTAVGAPGDRRFPAKEQSTSQRLQRFPKAEAGRRPDAPGHRARDPPSKPLPPQRQRDNIELAKPRSFDNFALHSGLQVALGERFPKGKTTPIQSLALAQLLSPLSAPGTDVQSVAPPAVRAILGAETGSGKTLAYLLPLLHHLKETDVGPAGAAERSGPAAPRALVLSPTHELTRQSTAVAKGLTHTAKLTILGASSPGSVKDAGAVDALFVTGRNAASLLGIPREDDGKRPARRQPWHQDLEPKLDLSRTEWVVIDEADVLLGPDFVDETASILDKLPKNVNVLLVTATLPPSLERAIETTSVLKTGPKFSRLLSPGLHRLPRALETRFVPWSKSGNALADVAHEIKRGFAEDAFEASLVGADKSARSMAVVFCSSVNKVDATVRILESKDVTCLSWTGESAHRVAGHNGPLDAFLVHHKRRSGATGVDPQPPAKGAGPRVLVTTSLLSRGLDFAPEVSTIYLLDPPRNVLDFVHRAGRAGRASRPGRVVVFGMSHAGQAKYGNELRDVLGKTETRAAVKPGGRTWEGKRSQSGGRR